MLGRELAPSMTSSPVLSSKKYSQKSKMEQGHNVVSINYDAGICSVCLLGASRVINLNCQTCRPQSPSKAAAAEAVLLPAVGQMSNSVPWLCSCKSKRWPPPTLIAGSSENSSFSFLQQYQ